MVIGDFVSGENATLGQRVHNFSPDFPDNSGSARHLMRSGRAVQ
ncbi:hypothetical protein ACZ87_01653 [Candidatus Erwinia dacicola]|uniref:Uncharacterized protein n=1 Tax=Candidatus Erwinia dacicola TaxID=252393 RepID=A0A328TME4_9GAMM|nr:hypothetical protein ACZ87_01653 [Candidatus Erwinia dacicola]